MKWFVDINPKVVYKKNQFFKIGTFFHIIGHGVPKDLKKAIELSEKLANQGSLSAQMNLARLYYEGKGGQIDRAKAIKWIKRAADQDFKTAIKIKRLA